MSESKIIGPSVDSNDKNERIEARRIRIKQRQEEQKRNAQLANVTDSAESLRIVKEEMAQSRRQMEESYARLKKLHEEGFEMSTNIRVSGDLREVNRRMNDDEANAQRKEKISMESKIAAEKFEEITMKWDVALKKELAHELYQMLKEQKSSCDAMLEEKNKLINECQTVLKEKDEEYIQELKRQSEDIDLLIERMEHQVKEMTNSYQKELELIESAFIEERCEMLNEMSRRWNNMLIERRQKEMDYMKRREEKVEEYESQLNQLRITDCEEYNRLKIELENIIQMGQMELQHHKVLYQNNHERLEYNFQVIRKRDEESTITKALQKRKITKLHDIILTLRVRLEKEEEESLLAKNNLSKEFKSINDQYKHLVTKSKINTSSEIDKYRQIWLLNEMECKSLLNKLVDIDKCLVEQQLGLNWTPPDTDFLIERDNIYKRSSRVNFSTQESNNMNEAFPYKATSNIGRNNEFYADYFMTDDPEKKALEDKCSSHSDGYYENYFIDKTLQEAHKIQPSKISAVTLKCILDMVCDESGFLLEEKIRDLLAPLEKNEKNLLKLDTILNVLDVTSTEDIENMATYFMRAKFPPELKNIASDDKLTSESSSIADEEIIKKDYEEVQKRFINSNDSLLSIPQIHSNSSSSHQYTIDSLAGDSFDIMNSESMQLENKGSVNCTFSNSEYQGGEELISPNEVVKALKSFVLENKNKDDIQKYVEKISFTASSPNKNLSYFKKFSEVIDEDKIAVWDTLSKNFEKYYQVLCSREKLMKDRSSLCQQNSELKQLLNQYMNSQVNSELQIPPTKTMNFNKSFNP